MLCYNIIMSTKPKTTRKKRVVKKATNKKPVKRKTAKRKTAKKKPVKRKMVRKKRLLVIEFPMNKFTKKQALNLAKNSGVPSPKEGFIDQGKLFLKFNKPIKTRPIKKARLKNGIIVIFNQ